MDHYKDDDVLGQFSQLSVFSSHGNDGEMPSDQPPVKHKMEPLAEELSSALDEASSACAGVNRRKLLRRRCKSASNLNLSAAHSRTTPGSSLCRQQSGDDSSSDNADDAPREGLAYGDAGRCPLSDSDEHGGLDMSKWKQATRRVASAPRPVCPGAAGHGDLGDNAESDSVNEHASPVRPNTKRKRKFKRMAIDPSAASLVKAALPVAATQTIKRKKVRSKHPPPGARHVSIKTSAAPSLPARQRQMSGITPGKRKRSVREKSVETDLAVQTRPTAASKSVVIASMECDDDQHSSSSLSSTEWEDQDSVDEPHEADDEQSDWPGHEPGAHSLLTDDEDEPDSDANQDPATTDDMTDLPPLSALAVLASSEGLRSDLQLKDLHKLTATARQAYLAHMKRLAECVPGREIRAGTRRLRARQTGFTIKSSSSEQLSRFLQDPNRASLRLNVVRHADRGKIVHLANLYNLSLRYEEPHLLVLSKTGKTVKVDEFLVPKAPSKHPNDVKRRRKTPPQPNEVEC